MKQLFGMLLLLCSVGASAQDVIVKKDGSTILSKVLEVNTADIKYKKFSNQDGPIYTISKSEIMSINYENGEKDTFDTNVSEISSSDNSSSQRLVKKPADARNKELLSLYNRTYETIGMKKKSSVAKYTQIIYGVKSSSVMSNEEIEMRIVRVKGEYGHDYYINLKNKTDKTLYIDKGNCFRVYNDGTFHCYYDNTEQTTVNIGGSSGGSLGLGSVAGALGVGGVAGQIAGGIRVGGESSHSVSKTYSKQRVIAIPPHGNRNLTENKWIETKKVREKIESAEYFVAGCTLANIEQGIVNIGDVRIFSEDELNWKMEYIVTYATEEDFSTYSSVNAELFIHEVIGIKIWSFNADKNIRDIDEYTITE